METLRDTVKNVMQALEAKQKTSLKDNPALLLRRVFSKEELKHAQFGYFKNGLLCVNVDSSGWMFQLSLKKEQLLKRLQQHLRTVKDIKFRLGV